MKNFKRCSILILAMVMCTLLVTTVWAVNANDVTYSGTFDDASLCVSDKAQTVVLAVKANTAVEMDSLDADVTVPDGFTVTGIANDDLGFVSEGDYPDVDLTQGTIVWFSPDAENVTTDLLAVITVTVPANTPAGNYDFTFLINTISKDYGEDIWEDGATVTATLTISEHSFTTKASGNLASAQTCEAAATYYAQCDNCDVVSTTKTVAVGEPKDHAWGTPAYTDNGDGTHTASYVCGNDANHTKSDAPAEHDFANGDCVCGAVALTVVKRGDSISYTVSGRVVTVTHSAACKVGYLSGDKYVTTGITMSKVSDTSYSYTIPANVSEVLIVVKGDVTGEGSILTNDVSRLNAYVLGKTTLTAEALFAADVTGEGSVLTNDVSRLNATVLGKTELTW